MTAAGEPAADRCPNCGGGPVGRYCPACGQDQRDPRRSPARWVRELLAEELSLDSRIPRTLHALLLRPGLLTEEWVRGRRARHVAPLRLFLGSVALFFAVTFALGLPFSGDLTLPRPSLALGDSVWELVNAAVGAHMQTVLTVATLLLAPAYALVLWPVNARVGSAFADHVVFSLHQHTTLLLLATVAWPLFFLYPWGVLAGALVLLLAGFHTLRAYRRVYALGRWGRRFGLATAGWLAAVLGLLVIGAIRFNAVMNTDALIFRDHGARLVFAAYGESGQRHPAAQRELRVLALRALEIADRQYPRDRDAFWIADLRDHLDEPTDASLQRLEATLTADAEGLGVLAWGLASALRAERGDTAQATSHARTFLDLGAEPPVAETSIWYPRYLELVERARALVARGPRP